MSEQKSKAKNSLFPPKRHGESLNRISLILSHSLLRAVRAMSYKQVTFFSFPFNGVSKGKRVNQSRKNVGKKSSYGINKRFGENKIKINKIIGLMNHRCFQCFWNIFLFFLFFSVLNFLPNKICINRGTETWKGCYIGNSRTPLCNKL